ncbi:MAG: glycosyl hydrolase-related protein [Gemmatimonadota bacterium]
MPQPRLTFHLIPHTHWDREWYLSRARFGARLVEMVDDLIDLLEREPSIPGFLLDGQTVLLEDYLTVRPEQESRVCALVGAGRLETGPWYVLADEQIPSGEALIRNLLIGTDDAIRWGRRMNVLYSPDAFGHPAILPLLANEFGIRCGVAWRGLGGNDGDLLQWRGPDGRTMVLYHLPPDGYEIGSALQSDASRVKASWVAVRTKLVARARSRHIAVLVGADHHAARQDLVTLRDAIAAIEPESEVRLSRLEDFGQAVESENQLPMVQGEQRAPGYTWVLQDVHSTRAHQKRRNSRLELWLERFAEPLAALAALAGGRDRRPLLRSGWRNLVQCHFHDAIGGCASDMVAREVDCRFASVEGTIREIVRGSLDQLSAHDPDRAREHPEQISPSMLLWNPAARVRTGVVLAEITMFRRDILVGPPGDRTPRVGRGFQPFCLTSSSGQEIPVQVLDVVAARERLDAKTHYPDQDEVDVVHVAFHAPEIGGVGLVALGSKSILPGRELSTGKTGRTLRNEMVQVRLETDGTLTLTNRLSGRTYPGILAIECEEDIGDTYSFCPGPNENRRLKASRVRILKSIEGPLVSTLEARWSLASEADRRRAGDHRIDMHLTLALVAGEPAVRCTLTLTNRGLDQRIRARFATGVPGISALAGSQLGSVLRPPAAVQATGYSTIERPALTAPAHRFVAAADTHGIGIFAPGFFEYELSPTGNLRVTLLRSVGQLSKNDLITRPGHAGWPTSTPLAQCLGEHRIDLAISPLAGRICRDGARLHALWENTFLPIRSLWLRDCIPSPDLPDPASTIELEGDGVIVSAIKPAEDGNGVVLRCYSARDETVEAKWRLGFRATVAELCRADETVIEELPLEEGGHVVRCAVAPRGVSTIRMRVAKT